MCTLKDIVLVKYAATFIDETLMRILMYNRNKDEWINTVRRRLSAYDIPLTLKEEIIVFLKVMILEVEYWRADHEGIFTRRQELKLNFCFNSDGMLNRIKTADSLIHSIWLDEKTRFVLGCQYWSNWDVTNFFEKMAITSRNEILRKYSGRSENLNVHEKIVVKWIDDFRAGSIVGPEPWPIFSDTSLQSRRLDDLSEDACAVLLCGVFESTDKMHIRRFCLSKMSANDREHALTHFPLKVLNIYLFWPFQHFFMDAANKVYDQLSGEDFTNLLGSIIFDKILGSWTDFNYLLLLQQFWNGSPDHLKQSVEGTSIFETLMEILKKENISS